MIAELFFLLIFGHVLGDYALRGDAFMAQASERNGSRTVPWWAVLSAHSMIHAGIVLVITNSVLCGILEFFAHFVIDWAKDNRLLGDPKRALMVDQALHVLCKAGYVVLLLPS